MSNISRIAQCLVPSATGTMNARQLAMKQQGITDVISLSVGEPDFRTPDNICQAAHRAIDAGHTTYAPHAGITPLREAIASKLRADNGAAYAPDQVCVTTGAKLSIFASLLALCGPGDEVIVPTPCWVSYTEQIHMVGATPVLVEMPAGAGFQLDAGKIERAITPRTKAIIINSPNNPTGVVYTRQVLEDLERVVRKHNLSVISDEIYEKLVYEADHPFLCFASISDYALDRTIVINGVSKAYAMTGWRIGYSAGPKEFIKPIISLIGHLTSNATSISQYAALEAISGPQDSVKRMVEQFGRRREYLLGRLNALPGFQCMKAEGAFYLFPNIRGCLGKTIKDKKIETSLDLSECILEHAHVGTIPGVAFAAPDHIRLSYANSMENIAQAMDRIEALIRQAQ